MSNMEIIVYVDENGTQEGDCEYRAIDICNGDDEQSLFIMIGHALADNYKFEKVEVLSEKEYQRLMKFRDTHPEFMKLREAQILIENFHAKYGSV